MFTNPMEKSHCFVEGTLAMLTFRRLTKIHNFAFQYVSVWVDHKNKSQIDSGSRLIQTKSTLGSLAVGVYAIIVWTSLSFIIHCM